MKKFKTEKDRMKYLVEEKLLDEKTAKSIMEGTYKFPEYKFKSAYDYTDDDFIPLEEAYKDWKKIWNS